MASILVIGPHPDDQELGMGGTIIRLAQQGHKVHIVELHNGEPPPPGAVETRAREPGAARRRAVGARRGGEGRRRPRRSWAWSGPFSGLRTAGWSAMTRAATTSRH